MPSNLMALAERVEAATGSDNALDVLIDVALFEPGRFAKAIRANAAGTKLIMTDSRGNEQTYWAEDWTSEAELRRSAAEALKARASQVIAGEES